MQLAAIRLVDVQVVPGTSVSIEKKLGHPLFSAF